MATRLTGSSDLYQADNRRPVASINFITSHDGFTLADLVSYNDKHNEANGYANTDGESHNRSWNLGAEGPTTNPEVINHRQRQQRNLLVTLMLSPGVPMMTGGDEIGRTQRGNNNAYCQDNEVTWYDWTHTDKELLDFTRRLIALRKAHPVFRRRRWFHGQPIRGVTDIVWFKPDGTEMTEDDWGSGFAQSIGVLFNGEAIPTRDERGRRIVDDSFITLLNAHQDAIQWRLPQAFATGWEYVLDTTNPGFTRSKKAPRRLSVGASSVVLLRRQRS
jgi:glycogen operon protein